MIQVSMIRADPKGLKRRGEIEIVNDAMELSFQKYSTLIVWETLVIASDPLWFLRALRDSARDQL